MLNKKELKMLDDNYFYYKVKIYEFCEINKKRLESISNAAKKINWDDDYSEGLNLKLKYFYQAENIDDWAKEMIYWLDDHKRLFIEEFIDKKHISYEECFKELIDDFEYELKQIEEELKLNENQKPKMK